VRKSAVGILSLVAALVGSGSALAGGAVVSGYGGEGGNVQNEVAGSQAVHAASGALPFTGLSLALIVGAAVLLVVLGLVLRRAARPNTPAV
jgi:hypothetical protein